MASALLVVSAVALAAAGCGEPKGDGGASEDPAAPGPSFAADARASARPTGGRGGGGSGPDSALRAMAAELVPAVESAASLSFRRPPRLARSSRDALEAFLTGELDEQWPEQRARAVRDAYARLGLVPDTLDLRGLLKRLYMEQVVGFYDPEADTLFVREDVDREMVRPVLVHELVHALQDQHLDLDSLTEARRGRNDAGAAARAALEGHAMYAMLEWQLTRRADGPVDLTRLPNLSELGDRLDLSALGAMPALAGAPRVLRETLVFPYLGGLGLMQALWRNRPERPAPFRRWMPISTEQVLHPGRLLSDPPDAPTRIRFAAEGDRWRSVHADALGELETRIWLGVHLADSVRARAAAAGWDGDRYRLLRTPDGREALAWATVWDTPAEADEFRSAAADALDDTGADGTDRERTVRRREVEGRPVVTVWDGPAGTPPDRIDRLLRVSLEGGR